MISMDRQNPNTLFAGMWDFRRKGWTFRSGGDGPEAPSGSGLFKSTDGGATWTELERDVARASRRSPGAASRWRSRRPSRASSTRSSRRRAKNGLYRSDDGGATWQPTDRSQNMVWRPFYFAHLIVDPKDPIEALQAGPLPHRLHRRRQELHGHRRRRHGDFHDLWIDPTNSDRIIAGDDGGVWYSYDGGNQWWKGDNLPISQFYHVSVDMDRPYHVYGGLQDNSSWVG